MSKESHPSLSRRERQIMDIVYRRGRATAAEVLADMPSPPGYSAVRAMLRILEDKGHLKHLKDGPRYVYRPTRRRDNAGRSALRQALETFFGGSVEKAVAALLSESDADLSPEELDRLAQLVEKARKEDRQP